MNEWRCYDCKAVMQSHTCPAHCEKCPGRTFSLVDPSTQGDVPMGEGGGDTPRNERTHKNAGAWAGPFAVSKPTMVLHGVEFVPIMGKDGDLYAHVCVEDCGKGGLAAARARAQLIAETLNSWHTHAKALNLPEGGRVDSVDVPLVGEQPAKASDTWPLIEATIGRLYAGQRNEANGPELCEWYGSMADDLQQALDQLREADQLPTDTQAKAWASFGLDNMAVSGSVLALAQSLKTMAEAAAPTHPGWRVIAQRAERFVRGMALQVTRLLAQPDLRLRHASVDADLMVVSSEVQDNARVHVHCCLHEGGSAWTFPLDELTPAGPVNDAVRLTVTSMMQTVIEDAVGQIAQAGGLPGLATYAELSKLPLSESPFAAGGQVAEVVVNEPGSETVHHLGAHAEYVMAPDSPHAVGFDPPEEGDD